MYCLTIDTLSEATVTSPVSLSLIVTTTYTLDEYKKSFASVILSASDTPALYLSIAASTFGLPTSN